MKFAAALLLTQVLATAVRAETLPEKLVAILKDVCLPPMSPEAMMAAGEKMAAAENWKLVRSGPAPIPVMHMENSARVSYESVWKVGGPDGSQAFLYIS